MKKIKKSYITFLLGIIFFIMLLLYFIINDRKLSIIERVIKDSILLVEKTIYKPFNKEETTFYDYALLEKDKKIKELEELLNLKNNMSDYDLINSTVISRNSSSWYQNLTIDKGLNDDLEEDLAVIGKNGLIGKITKLTNHTSVIRLLTSVNDKYKISVKIESNNDLIYGIITEYKRNQLIIVGVDKNVQIDSIVKTSGLDNKFPSDILIGKVTKIEKDNFDLISKIYVEPANNFNHISYVTILKRKNLK